MPPPPPPKKRSVKEARRARKQAMKRLRRYLLMGGVGLFGVLVIIGLVLPPVFQGPRRPAPAASPFAGTPVPTLEPLHIPQGQPAPPNAYNSVPPTSGVHWPSPARCGIYEERQPDEALVHSLEHGFVIVHYHPDLLPPEEVERLKEVVQGVPGFPSYLILQPNPTIDRPIALTAWGYLLYLDGVEEEAILGFINAHRAQGPELGAPGC